MKAMFPIIKAIFPVSEKGLGRPTLFRPLVTRLVSVRGVFLNMTRKIWPEIRYNKFVISHEETDLFFIHFIQNGISLPQNQE